MKNSLKKFYINLLSLKKKDLQLKKRYVRASLLFLLEFQTSFGEAKGKRGCAGPLSCGASVGLPVGWVWVGLKTAETSSSSSPATLGGKIFLGTVFSTSRFSS